MPVPGPRLSRTVPESARRRVEVAGAMAWESVIATHAQRALEFIQLMREYGSFEEALTRYLREMDVTETVGSAVRTQVLIDLEQPEERAPQLQVHDAGEDVAATVDDEPDVWDRLRPNRIAQNMRERQRRKEESIRWLELFIASAEESLILTHIDNAITFVALLEGHMPMSKAVQFYLGTIALTGGRSQSVFQRTMARLAEVHLPLPGLARPIVNA